MSKTCNKCNITKDIFNFWSRPDSKDGHRNECKACHAEYFKKYYVNNKSKILPKAKEYALKRYHENKIKRHQDEQMQLYLNKNIL